MHYVLSWAVFASLLASYRYASSKLHGVPFSKEWPLIRLMIVLYAFALAGLYVVDAYADDKRIDMDEIFGEWLLTPEKTQWYLDRVNRCHCNAVAALEAAEELSRDLPDYTCREMVREAIIGAIPVGTALYKGNVSLAAIAVALDAVAIYGVKCYDRMCDIMDLLLEAKSQAHKAEDYAVEMLRLRRHPRLID